MSNTRKLAQKLKDKELAAALVEAGFDNPAKIRAASDKDLEKVKGVGKAKVGKIRDKIKAR